jgi:hypothetical protein
VGSNLLGAPQESTFPEPVQGALPPSGNVHMKHLPIGGGRNGAQITVQEVEVHVRRDRS